MFFVFSLTEYDSDNEKVVKSGDILLLLLGVARHQTLSAAH